MLRSVKEIIGYDILAKDGEIGKVHDFYFDTEEWEIRYLVVDTGPWILGRKVLISPVALEQPVWIAQKFPVNLTREQVENSPDIDTEKPVSRQQQRAIHEYFRWPSYWQNPFSSSPAAVTTMQNEMVSVKEKLAEDTDAHLRKAKEVIGYNVEGRDESIGKVDDFILDDENWVLRYLVLDAGSIMQEKKVLIAPFWISWVRYDNKEVSIDLTKQMIEDSPAFDHNTPIQREYEEVLYDFYGRPYYWID